MELGDSVYQERLSKGLGVVQSEKAFRKAVEAELDLIEQEPQTQGSLAELVTQRYRFQLLGFAIFLLEREDKRQRQKTNCCYHRV